MGPVMWCEMVDQFKTSLLSRLKNYSIMTISIILINVVVYIVTSRDSIGLETIFSSYGLIPAKLKAGQLLTSCFFHNGLIGHLLPNMALLYLFGRQLEQAMGKLEYILFYIGACFAGSILHVAIIQAAGTPHDAEIPVVGASGAVAAVAGAYMVRYHRKTFNLGGMEIPALIPIAGWVALQLLFGISGLYGDFLLGINLKYVSYWSHLGGFTFGIVIALLSNMALFGEREYLTAEAQKHYDEGNLLEAAQNYESLLKYDPDNAEAHNELGRIWAILEEEDQSIPYYHCAVEFYIGQGREAEALETAEEMKQFWPDSTLNAATRFRLATYLEETGETEQAVLEFQRIARDEPKSEEAQMSLLKVGQLQLSALRNPQSSIHTLQGFLEKYPQSEWKRFVEETLTRAEDTIAQKTARSPRTLPVEQTD